MFSSGKEIIKLNHEAFDRALYSEGALSAANWLKNKKSGLYSMRDLINFELMNEISKSKNTYYQYSTKLTQKSKYL